MPLFKKTEQTAAPTKKPKKPAKTKTSAASKTQTKTASKVAAKTATDTKDTKKRTPRTNPAELHRTGTSRRALSPADRANAQTVFLREFAKRGIVSDAAAAARVTRKTVYNWRANDAEFGARFQEASEVSNDAIRKEIWRRAITGYEEEHIVGGRMIRVKRFSDQMLRLLAISRMRSEFADRVDVTSNGQSLNFGERISIALADPDTQQLADDLLVRLAGPITVSVARREEAQDYVDAVEDEEYGDPLADALYDALPEDE